MLMLCVSLLYIFKNGSNRLNRPVYFVIQKFEFSPNFTIFALFVEILISAVPQTTDFWIISWKKQAISLRND